MISIKTREHLRRKAALALPRWGALAAGALALGGALLFIRKTMRVVSVTDTHGESGMAITCAAALGDVMAQAGVTPVGADDVLRITTEDSADRIHVLRAFTVPVTADGRTVDLVTADETVGELLRSAGIAVGADDLVEPALDTPLREGDSVTLRRVRYNDYTVEEAVPIETEYRYSSLYYRNTDYSATLASGREGVDQVSYREVYIDGELTETYETARTTLTEMEPAVVKCYGEGAPVSIFTGPEIVDGRPAEGVAAVYTSKRATGYSASLTAKGASGMRLTYGTVAINPTIIPYGSLMYIPSDDGRFVYGYAHAADTGIAMMDGRAFIDLYYETYAESVSNAVIPVTIYVLDSETAAQYKETNDALRQADLADHH